MVYRDFGTWIRTQFSFRVQKISVDAGFSCPNRDGTKGTGGCIFCNNDTFNPTYCDRRKTITEQLDEGRNFFARKYSDMKYLAYFQAYSNTYAPLEKLKEMYEKALAAEDIVGLVIGTRPDCVDEEKLDYLEELSKRTFIIVEYGIESCNDNTLKLINRQHDFATTRWAIEETHKRGITTGGHVILGLPGEDREEILQQAKTVSSLSLDILKIHQLQVIRGTKLAEWVEKGTLPKVHLYSVEEYIDLLVEYIKLLRKDLILERFVSQSPKDLVLAPSWNLKNHEFTDLLNKKLNEL